MRSVVKALSYRGLGTATTSALALALTGRLDLALALGGLEAPCKLALRYLHERAWDRLWLDTRSLHPAVVWFTGLPSSGKSTIAGRVYRELESRGFRVEHLDGDSVRSIFPTTGFTRAARDEHVKRIGYLASRLETHGVFVIASFVSPYAESRRFVRELCQNFIEVHVSTPLDECERRDVKGLYARARRGEITHLTGLDDPYEPPELPELRIDTRHVSLDDACATVLRKLKLTL